MLLEIIHKYLIEDDDLCMHCHKNKRQQGSSICPKCSKELESFRAKNKKKEDK